MEIPNKKKKKIESETPAPASHTDEILGHILQNEHQHSVEKKAIAENHLQATAHGNKLLENGIEAHGRTIEEHKKTNEILKDMAPNIKEQSSTTAKMAKFLEEMKGEKGDDAHTPTDEELLALIKPLIPEPIPGHTPTDEELLALIKPLIPEVEDGETPSDEHLLSLIQSVIHMLPVPEVIHGHTPTKEEIMPIVEEALAALPEPEKVTFPTADEIVEMLKGKISYDDLKDKLNLETFRGRGSSKTVALNEVTGITVSATAPQNPVEGDLWVDIS